MTKKKKRTNIPVQDKPAHPAIPGKPKPATSGHFLLILLLMILVVSAVRFSLAGMPLERDEGEYAYMGQLILKGIPPYEIAYNMKLPGTYYMYALLMAVFGQTSTGIHIGLTLLNAGTMLLLFFGLRIFFNGRIALFAAGCYGILALSPHMLGFAAHATHFVVLFVAAGIFFLARYSEGHKGLHLFLSAMMFGTSLLMKQHAAAFMVFGGVMFLLLEFREPGTSMGKRVARLAWRGGIYVAGALLPYLLVLVVAKLNGTFDKLWFWTVSYASQYASANTWQDGKNLLKLTVLPIWKSNPWIFVLAGLGLGSLFLRGTTLMQKVFALALFLFGILAVVPGFHFRHHYMIVLLPAVGLFGGIAVETLAARFSAMAWKAPHPGILTAASVVVLFALYAGTLASNPKFYFADNAILLSKSLYRTNPTVEAIDIARYIKKNTSPDDKIAILGSEPEILFYSDRLSATGYIYTYNMVEAHAYNLKMQEEMIAEIEKARPVYVVFVNVTFSWLTHPGAPKKIFEWADAYFKEHYTVAGLVDIPDRGASDYYWDVVTNNPKHKSNIWIFRRKS